MHEVNLITLRRLRERARALLRSTLADLRPFAKADGTFRRKPDSPSIDDDVNVTTTCSCVMALAGTNSFHDFYKKQAANDADSIFKTMVDAPWMSSGLTANNAFTTALVIRTFGFLLEEDLFKKRSGDDGPIQSSAIKNWELHLGIKNVSSLAKKIKERADLASEFLWLSLSDKTREDLIQKLSGTPALGKERTEKELRAVLALDLRRIIQCGWIYDEKKFTRASAQTKELLAKKPTGYKMAAVNHQLLVDQYPDEFDAPARRSLTEIAVLMASDADNFSINEYPPSTAVVYWFVDGVDRGQINLEPEQWTVLCNWAAKEFNHERSLVVAEHDAVMDPVAMGMSACLCARLRTISEKARLGTKKEHAASLPSNVELERSIEELLLKQTKSGIFPKYFPMFHYQDAGSNFCFTFELLEAMLHEFGRNENRLLARPEVIRALETAVTWCENNRYGETTQYAGWNSGGDLKTVRKEQPESWATAVVHMFLWELTTVISRRIQRDILRKYKARDPKPRQIAAVAGSTSTPALDELLDIEIVLQGKSESLRDELRLRIIEHYRSQNEVTLRRKPIKKPLSALLFGPPGTSKTEVTKAVADDLNWPMVEITPSDFVTGTLANIYLRADEIFDDLMDLAGVVVFFDEMDALVQAREGEVHLDIASQFLTTTMLPKLTRLHDQAQVVFFMATNFQDRFDAAIKRAGRFDLLLCMGPPKLSEKLDRLHRVYLMDVANEHTKKAGEAIKNHLKDKPVLQDQLALYTFGEYKAFLRTFADAEIVDDAVSKLDDTLSKIVPAKFQEQLNDYSQFVTLKLPDLEPLKKIVTWTDLADLEKKKFTLRDVEKENVEKENIPITHIVRYFCDRQQSKEQY